MLIGVISDLHLAPAQSPDSFGHCDEEFIRFLTRLEQDAERIVLLGDIWETLTTQRPGDAATGLRLAREAHPRIAEHFESPKYSYVHGNHDAVAGRLEHAPEQLILDADGVRLLFAHGHQFDGLTRYASTLSEWCVWLGAWLQRLGLGAFYRMAAALDARASRPKESPEADLFQRLALELGLANQADVVVTGHTHFARRVEHSAGWYLNSGSCSEGQLSHLLLDTKRGCFDLVHA